MSNLRHFLQAEWVLDGEDIEVQLESRIVDAVLQIFLVKTIQSMFLYVCWCFINGEMPSIDFELADFRPHVVGLHGELALCKDDFEGCAEVTLDESLDCLDSVLKEIFVIMIYLGGFSRNAGKLRLTRGESSSGKGCLREILD